MFSFEGLKRRGGEAVGQMTVPRWMGWRQATERPDKPRWTPTSILIRVLICLLVILVPVYFIFLGGNRIWNWNNLDSSLATDGDWSPTGYSYTTATHVGHAEFNRSQPCRGARGLPLEEGMTEDLPRRTLELSGHYDYTNNTYGSYEALDLRKSWMTFEQRYGPYGFNEDDAAYNFTRVDWSKIDWAVMQDECAATQTHNPFSGNFIQPEGKPRMHFRDEEPFPVRIEGKTGRQAIVVRTWTGFIYTDEDKWNLRSLITEAALATGGEYTVYLLVHVKGEGREIYTDPKKYQETLEAYVPREFQKMAVLFHRSLLENWYPKVEEYTPFWQIMQPMQLFATFYPEYDHYWQIEMDTRFTGRVDEILQSFHDFGKKQPYKQSRERASWTYMAEAHGTYDEFTAKIDKALKGGAKVWGPTPKTSVGEFVHQIGPDPPVPDAKDDNFEWRVGEEPDLLLLERVVDPSLFEPGFIFKDWFRGFDKDTPRLHSPNAQCRVSRALLHQVHAAQVNYGVRLPGESTMPTFALWNGLQIVHLPIPKYLFQPRDVRELGYIHNGGKIHRVPNGIANAIDVYYRGAVSFYARPNTFCYKSSLAGPAFQRWMDSGHLGPSDSTFRSEDQKRPAALEGEIPDGIPTFMREVDGSVYMPNMILHPRKTSVKYA